MLNSIPVGDDSNKQAFQLSIVSSYIFKNLEDFEGYQPPAPPVLFKVPYDVFYPFLTSDASARSPLSILSVIGLVAGSTLMLFVSM
jgi:hypothetical protein